MKKLWLIVLSLCGGCMYHAVEVEPVHVDPIHVTVDVNVHDEAQAGEAD